MSTQNNQQPHKKAKFSSFVEGNENHEIISSYSGKRLKPFIWKDFEANPKKLQLLKEIEIFHNVKKGNFIVPEKRSIDYCYLSSNLLSQVNSLLCSNFWPEIDEFLNFPDFTIIAKYKKLVIGCALMTPDAYISYITVHPDWRGCGIASFMIYHLIQTIPNKDITLHVSVTNKAMILYQKFGFKPEGYIVEFYSKYIPPEFDPKYSKHNSSHNQHLLSTNAFFLRLRR